MAAHAGSIPAGLAAAAGAMPAGFMAADPDGTGVTQASLPVGAGPDRFANATARIVMSIVTYTRWPSRPAAVRVCVIGVADHADRIGDPLRPSAGARAIQRVSKAAGATDLAQDCDAVYMGNLSPTMMRRTTMAVRGGAVLTIAEDDPACRSEAMFCLIYDPAAVSFRMNLDAISRSPLRIDPRILRMSRGN